MNNKFLDELYFIFWCYAGMYLWVFWIVPTAVNIVFYFLPYERNRRREAKEKR